MKAFYRGLMVSLCPVAVAVALAVPISGQVTPWYATDFEAFEGYQPGSLEGQDQWTVKSGVAEVVDGISESGEQSVRLLESDPAARISREIPGFEAEPVVFVDYFVRLSTRDLPPVEELSEEAPFHFVLIEEDGMGVLYVFDGDGIGGGEWRRLQVEFELQPDGGVSAFERVTARIDYISASVDFYVDGELAGIGFGFLDDSVLFFTGLVVDGGEAGHGYVDDVYAGVENPLFEDEFADGIDPGWKLFYGLDLTHGIRDEDTDGDGLTNIEEYFFGTDPTRVDTSRDGLSDGEAVASGVDPLHPSNVFPQSLPFFESFEDWPSGDIHARGGWTVSGGAAIVRGEAAFAGERGLSLLAGTEPAVAGVAFVETSEPVVWTDFHLRPEAHTLPVPPEIGEESAVALYFDDEGRAVAWNGSANEWQTIEIPGPLPAPGWVRVTIRQDFSSQSWSLWLNSVLVYEDLGFAAPSDRYKRLRISEPGGASDLDEVYVGTGEPAALDNDGDGLTNEEEIALGSDPNNPDTSGDGMWDGDKFFWEFDPIVFDDFARPAADGDGRYRWETDFETEEGFSVGALDGQEGWFAGGAAEISDELAWSGEQAVRLPAGESPAEAVRFVGAGDEKDIWVTAHVRVQPGELPNVAEMEDPRSVLIGVSPSGYVVGFDGNEERWVNSGFNLDEAQEWMRLDIHLDYVQQRWSLCVDGVLVLREVAFRDSGLRTLTRFGMRGASGDGDRDSWLDTMEIAYEEPAGLDFSGDGLTNDEKRALGLDIYSTDTTGDGLPDWWLVQHGIDPLDPGIGAVDLFGYGLTVRQEYLLGTDPNLADTDADGWTDFEEFLAGTDPDDPESAPLAGGLADWTVTRVGEGLAPHAFRVGEEYRLLGTGLGTERTEDGFTFAYREVSGNFEAVARIRAPEHLDPGPAGHTSWLSQNGLMARSGLEADARYSAVFSGAFWYWSRIREVPAAHSIGLTHEPVVTGVPKYVRMRRIGNRFRHYLSEDGKTWFLVSEVPVAMPEEIVVGMFASANADDLWVRGRLTDVEIFQIEDQSDWYVDDGEGGEFFDSFAWMGEWDGEGDYDRAGLALREPSLAELHEAELATSVAVEQSGAEAADAIGEWAISGLSLVSLERRGWVEFDLTVSDPDVFLLEFEGKENNSAREAVSAFELKFYLEDEYLGSRILEATVDDVGTVHVFTPWLESGTHRVRVLWDGARSRTHLEVSAIRLRAMEGPDGSGNGIKDWVEDRLSRQSGIEPQAPLFTYVSPLPLEGRDRFNSQVVVENVALLEGEPGEHRDVSRPFAEHPRGGIGRDFEKIREGLHLQGVPVSVPELPHELPSHPPLWNDYLSAWDQPVSFSVEPGPGHRFRSDVPLAPLVDNALTLSWQDGVAEERRMVRWVPYNVLEGGSMVLRQGDYLLLTAHEGDQQSGRIFLNIDGTSFETSPVSPVVYTFSEPGDYVIEGTYLHPNGQQYSGTLEVSVRGFAFPGHPLAYVGRQRDWEGGDGNGPAFEADPRLRLEAVSGGETLRFDSDNNAFMTLAARTSPEGPILDSVEVESFRLFSSWETYARVVDTLPDGTKVVEMMMILSPVPEDVRVRLEIFVGGILFDDGTLERWLEPEDFDELGQVTFRFIMPEEAITSVCHRTYVYQDDVLIGVR